MGTKHLKTSENKMSSSQQMFPDRKVEEKKKRLIEDSSCQSGLITRQSCLEAVTLNLKFKRCVFPLNSTITQTVADRKRQTPLNIYFINNLDLCVYPLVLWYCEPRIYHKKCENWVTVFELFSFFPIIVLSLYSAQSLSFLWWTQRFSNSRFVLLWLLNNQKYAKK